jgi:hypothetical protein
MNSSPANASPQMTSKAIDQARPWMAGLARFGHAARGMVYVVIGVLALEAAFGIGGRATNSKGALFTIANQPFGRILLALVGVGLAGYALWRMVQASLDPEGKGSDAKGTFKRLGAALSGLAYLGLAITAFRIVVGSGVSKNSSQRDWTAQVLAQPGGQWLIGLVGVVIIGFALRTFFIAYTAKFREKLKISEMSAGEDSWITRIGRVGHAAWGVVLVIIGWFFVRAAMQSDARQTGGLTQALQTLASQPHGRWLLGIVAIGVISYGLYALAEARFRKIYL